MSDFPSVAEIAAFVDDALRSELDPGGIGAYDSRPGSDNAVLVSVLTKVASGAYAYAADRKRAGITGSAEGQDLDDQLRDRYFDARKLAAAAVGTVYLQRAGTLLATTIPQGWRCATQSSDTSPAVQYEATITVAAPAGVARVAVPIACLQPGVVGNALLQAITEKVDPLEDTSWALYVPVAGDVLLGGAPRPDVIGGGVEAEDDDAVKARIRERPTLPAPGTRAGVYKGTTDVPGIVTAVPIEVGDGTGIVYAGDPGYQLPNALRDAVFANLENWRPFGVPITVRAMAITPVQVTARIYMQEPLVRYNVASLRDGAVAAIKRYFQYERKRPDEYFLDAIRTALAKASVDTQSVVLDAPAADVRRPTDAGYGVVTALSRYTVSDATIALSFFDPLTS